MRTIAQDASMKNQMKSKKRNDFPNRNLATVQEQSSNTQSVKTLAKRRNRVRRETILLKNPSAKISRVLGTDGLAAFNFAMSPGDFDAIVGFPGTGMNKTFMINNTLSQTITCPSTWTGTWNLVIIGVPSGDIPIYAFAYQGAAPNFSSPAGTTTPYLEGNVTNNIYVPGTDSVAVFPWATRSFALNRGQYKTYPGTHVKYTWPNSVLALAPNPDGAPFSDANGRVVGATLVSTDLQDNIECWRCTGMSTTMTYVGAVLNQSGVVTSMPLPNVLKMSSMSGPMDLTADAASSNTNPYSTMVTMRCFKAENIPYTAATLAAMGAYVGPVEQGCYVINRFVGPQGMFMDSGGEAGVLSLSTDPIGAIDRESPIWPVCRTKLNINQGSGNQDPGNWTMPIESSVDPAWTPTITYFTGLPCATASAPAASINIKVKMGMECTPRPGTTLAGISTKITKPCPLFYDTLAGVMAELPPAAPASENWEWSDVAKWAGTALSFIANIAPYVLPLL